MKTAKILPVLFGALIIGTWVLGNTSYASDQTVLVSSETTSTSTMLDFTVGKPGTAYYVVLPSGAVEPTAEQVKKGEDASGNDALSDSAATTGEDDEFDITGLEPSTGYTAYFTVQDELGNLAEVTSDCFTTLGSTPVLSIVANTDSYTTLDFTVGEPGTVHYVVLPSGAPAPTAEQIKAGQDAAGNDAISDSRTVTEGDDEFDITNLKPSTDYIVYFVAQDELGNWTKVVSTCFTTPAYSGSGTMQ